MTLDVNLIRRQFPALQETDDGRPRIYLDGPAGTQVPRQVIDRTVDYLQRHNANKGGPFSTARATDAILADAHQGMADLLNAPSADEIIFGANMTTLTYMLSRTLAHRFTAGDEIILTRMDHDANVYPWMQMAEEHHLTVRWLPFDRESYRFRLEELTALLSERTRLLAVCYASNAIGTINDIAAITAMARAAGALVFVDAVQYVPHGPTDVQALDCDFLACSVYKFFGGHQGVLWGRRDLLEGLKAYQVRPAARTSPGKFETGTQNHEGQAGTSGALEYLAWLGKSMAPAGPAAAGNFDGRRRDLHAAMQAIRTHEQQLSRQLTEGLAAIPRVTVHGICPPADMADRVPTVSFTMSGVSPAKIAETLAAENIFVWHGHYYAVEVVNYLGLADSGGMVRVGAVHYNTPEEIDTLLAAVRRIADVNR